MSAAHVPSHSHLLVGLLTGRRWCLGLILCEKTARTEAEAKQSRQNGRDHFRPMLAWLEPNLLGTIEFHMLVSPILILVTCRKPLGSRQKSRTPVRTPGDQQQSKDLVKSGKNS